MMSKNRFISLLALLLSGLGIGAQAQTTPPETPPATVTGPIKAETPEKTLHRANLDLSAASNQISHIELNTPTAKEYTGFLRRGWRIDPGDATDAPLHPFWYGQTAYNLTANEGDPNFGPLFHNQKYEWQFDGTGVLSQATGATADFPAEELDLSIDHNKKSLLHDFGELPEPPTPQELATGGAAVNQKLQAYITALSQFPKTTVIRARVKPEPGGTGSAIETTAKVKWHLPYMTFYKVTIHLKAQLANGQTIDASMMPDQDGCLDIPEVRQLLDQSDVIVQTKNSSPRQAVSTVGVQCVFALVGAVVIVGSDGVAAPFVEKAVEGAEAAEATGGAFAQLGLRQATSAELDETIMSRFIPWAQDAATTFNASRIAAGEEAAEVTLEVTTENLGEAGEISSLTEPIEVPAAEPLPPVNPVNVPRVPGQFPGKWTWLIPLAPHIAPVLPEVWDLGSDAVDTAIKNLKRAPDTNTGTGTGTGVDPSPDPDIEIKKDPLPPTTRDRKLSEGYYLYTVAPTYIGDEWLNLNNNPSWLAGYYLTNIPPGELAPIPNTPSKWRSGQLSFALYGHPYNFGAVSSVSWWELKPPQGVHPTPKGTTFDFLSGDYPVGARFYTPDLVGWTVLDADSVAMAPLTLRSPGTDDIPASDDPFPATKGHWLDPVTSLPLPSASVTQINPATQRKYCADSDWQPELGSPLYQITQGGAIPFRRGYPNFSDYTEYTATLDPMKGNTGSDFTNANAQFGGSAQFAAQTITVKQWIQDSNNFTEPGRPTVPDAISANSRQKGPNWVWHHNEDMIHMQLVPSTLNTARYGGLLHKGGADWAQKARW